MNELKEYEEFLKHKKKVMPSRGIEVSDSEINQSLFPFQKFCVQRALKYGKFALFEDCGLGKTIQQLEWSDKIVKKAGKSVIIVAPLAVIGQTIKEGVKFGYEVREIRRKEWGESALIVKSGNYYYNVSSEPEIFNEA